MVIRFLCRAALALSLAVVASEAVAECRGSSLLDRLDPQAPPELATSIAATPHGRGLLWSARRGEARILLAGTLHLPDPRHRATLLLLAPALRKTGLVLLETTPAEEAAMERAIAASPGLTVATAAPFLSDRLEPAAWTAMAAAAQARGIAPPAAARFRPWLLMMALSTRPVRRPCHESGARPHDPRCAPSGRRIGGAGALGYSVPRLRAGRPGSRDRDAQALAPRPRHLRGAPGGHA